MIWFKKPTDKEITSGIREGNRRILNYIYSKSYPQVMRFVLNHNGTKDEAKDVFQEGLYSIVVKSKNNELTIDVSFEAYLFKTARNIWLKRLADKNCERKAITETSSTDSGDDIHPELIKICNDALSNLTGNCGKIIKLHLKGYSHKEMKETLNFSSEGYSRKRLSNCLKKLTALVENDSRYKEIRDEQE